MRLGTMSRCAALTAALAFAACGDDDGDGTPPGEDAALGDAGAGGDAGPASDAGHDAGATNDAGGDAASADGGAIDGSAGPDLDATLEDAANPPSDGAGELPDATPSTDAGDQDASDAPDASLADASDTCQVEDTRFGCGVVRDNFVEFESGYTVDREARIVWAPTADPLGGNQEREGCGAESFEGVTDFVLPTIDEVRTLTAGCPQDCELATDVCTGRQCNDACTACAAGEGPHASGGYCRPELQTCGPMFTRDACDVGDSADCDGHQHWYYDASTGTFALTGEDVLIAGRCVGAITGEVP